MHFPLMKSFQDSLADKNLLFQRTFGCFRLVVRRYMLTRLVCISKYVTRIIVIRVPICSEGINRAEKVSHWVFFNKFGQIRQFFSPVNKGNILLEFHIARTIHTYYSPSPLSILRAVLNIVNKSRTKDMFCM